MRTIERTLIALRESGCDADVVERRVGRGRRSYLKDFLGIIDVIALQGCAIVGIQCGTDTDHAFHVRKALAEPRLHHWLSCEAKFEIWSWGRRARYNKDGNRGKVDAWTLRIQQIMLENGRLITLPAFNPKTNNEKNALSSASEKAR
jgi:hypothetical protein